MSHSKRVYRPLPVGRSILLGQDDPRHRRDVTGKITENDIEYPLIITDAGRVGVGSTQPVADTAAGSTLAQVIVELNNLKAILRAGGFLGR